MTKKLILMFVCILIMGFVSFLFQLVKLRLRFGMVLQLLMEKY